MKLSGEAIAAHNPTSERLSTVFAAEPVKVAAPSPKSFKVNQSGRFREEIVKEPAPSESVAVTAYE